MILVCFITVLHIKLYTYQEKNVREGKTAKVRLTSKTDASATGVIDKLSMLIKGK